MVVPTKTSMETRNGNPRKMSDASINYALEEVFLALRSAKQAEKELGGGLPKSGAIVIFPVAVFTQGQNIKKSIRPFPLSLSREPGTVLPPGVHKIKAKGTIKDWVLEGTFFVGVGEDEANLPEEKWRLLDKQGDYAPLETISNLPVSFSVPTKTRTAIKKEIVEMVDGTERYYDALYRLSTPTIKAALKKYQTALYQQSGHLDLNDVVQECWSRHLQRVDTYASPQRPNATWRQVLVINTKRDGGREIRKNTHRISDQVAQLIGVLRTNPEIQTPQELQEFVSIRREVMIRKKRNPKTSTVEIAKQVRQDWDQKKLKPKISLKIAKSAFTAAPMENTVSFAATLSDDNERTYDDIIEDSHDADAGIAREEKNIQEELLRELSYFLFPEQPNDFLLELGLLPDNYMYDGEKRMSTGELRRELLMKFKLPNEPWDQKEIQKRVAKVIFTDTGDIRPVSEIEEWFARYKPQFLVSRNPRNIGDLEKSE